MESFRSTSSTRGTMYGDAPRTHVPRVHRRSVGLRSQSAGMNRRAFIRAYASGIGLDPDDVLQEFLERFPDPAAPPRVTSSDGPAPEGRAPAVRPVVASTGRTVLRLTLAETRGAFVRGRLL